MALREITQFSADYSYLDSASIEKVGHPVTDGEVFQIFVGFGQLLEFCAQFVGQYILCALFFHDPDDKALVQMDALRRGFEFLCQKDSHHLEECNGALRIAGLERLDDLPGNLNQFSFEFSADICRTRRLCDNPHLTDCVAHVVDRVNVFACGVDSDRSI